MLMQKLVPRLTRVNYFSLKYMEMEPIYWNVKYAFRILCHERGTWNMGGTSY